MKMDVLLPKIKLIALLLIAVICIVLALQNMHVVVTRFVFITVNMPLAALLALTLLIGFGSGIVAALKLGRKEA